ncbi:hypothetical protein BJ508DRAFT_301529 [Ascobolus immersus RN42]|uniref:Uncharacterized protein n=1 Tax=Ascobolus immersus RN42 TaxID=1160509 RepID=A0A3N4IKQ0_ASCIM|nr:hypothetical protein BJ508DRAFT_301529 [Ascobolus immersus RN42]
MRSESDCKDYSVWHGCGTLLCLRKYRIDEPTEVYSLRPRSSSELLQRYDPSIASNLALATFRKAKFLSIPTEIKLQIIEILYSRSSKGVHDLLSLQRCHSSLYRLIKIFERKAVLRMVEQRWCSREGFTIINLLRHRCPGGTVLEDMLRMPTFSWSRRLRYHLQKKKDGSPVVDPASFGFREGRMLDYISRRFVNRYMVSPSRRHILPSERERIRQALWKIASMCRHFHQFDDTERLFVPGQHNPTRRRLFKASDRAPMLVMFREKDIHHDNQRMYRCFPNFFFDAKGFCEDVSIEQHLYMVFVIRYQHCFHEDRHATLEWYGSILRKVLTLRLVSARCDFTASGVGGSWLESVNRARARIAEMVSAMSSKAGSASVWESRQSAVQQLIQDFNVPEYGWPQTATIDLAEDSVDLEEEDLKIDPSGLRTRLRCFKVYGENCVIVNKDSVTIEDRELLPERMPVNSVDLNTSVMLAHWHLGHIRKTFCPNEPKFWF